MNVYQIKPEEPYSGGLIIVAARNKEEARHVGVGKQGEWFLFSEPKLLQDLDALVEEPQIITRDIYIE